ncbi:MAG TPA: hypothetical protein VMT30_05095 [Candidatus Saccharimonadia bacterium]|nr:hypothetical protein [Candidatus Saccharimonadia bacterium]
MKRRTIIKSNIITSTLLAAAVAIASFAPRPADAAVNDSVQLTGLVTIQGHPMPGLEVDIECWSTGFQAHAVTNGSGIYSHFATEAFCPLGSQLKVRFESVGLSGYVGFNYNTIQKVTVTDISLVRKNVVPEYGWLGGLLAGSAGIGAMAIMRRRYVSL